MYLTKYEIAVATGGTDNIDYSDYPVNGFIHAIQYTVTPDTPIVTTGAFTVGRENSTDTWGQFLNGKAATTDNWYFMPRYKTADSTAASTAWNSTAHVPDYYAIAGERIKSSLVGATSAGAAGTITVWVQGGA